MSGGTQTRVEATHETYKELITFLKVQKKWGWSLYGVNPPFYIIFWSRTCSQRYTPNTHNEEGSQQHGRTGIRGDKGGYGGRQQPEDVI